MIPDQIVNDLLHTKDKVDGATKAIEAIKQYAREMCRKQISECVKSYNKGFEGFEYHAMKNAPYPKELL